MPCTSGVQGCRSGTLDTCSIAVYAGVVTELQGSLLDLADDVVVHALRSVRRTHLSHGAWVDVMTGFVGGADRLYAALRREVPWQAERRQMYDSIVDVPRLLRFYGEREPLPHPALDEARDALSAHYADELGEPFTTAGLCLYRDGHDSVAWHGDRIGRSRDSDTMVAILSVGAPRDLVLRPAEGEPRSRCPPATATWSSWAAPASAPGTTACPRPPSRSGRGSPSSSAPLGCAETTPPRRAGGHSRLRLRDGP